MAKRFFNDDGIKPVILGAIIFSLIHIHIGIIAVIITFVGGIIFGIFYLRHNNLIGVTLLHYSGGVVAFLSGTL